MIWLYWYRIPFSLFFFRVKIFASEVKRKEIDTCIWVYGKKWKFFLAFSLRLDYWTFENRFEDRRIFSLQKTQLLHFRTSADLGKNLEARPGTKLRTYSHLHTHAIIYIVCILALNVIWWWWWKWGLSLSSRSEENEDAVWVGDWMKVETFSRRKVEILRMFK